MMEATYYWRANRRGIVRKGRSKPWFFALIAVNVFIIVGVWFHSKGASVTVEANVSDADFLVGQARAHGTGSAVFRNIPYGTHPVTVERRFYKTFGTTVHVGWFGSPHLRAILEPLPVELVVRTLPRAEVLIDGCSAGRAAGNGIFSKANAPQGRHTITSRLAGYEDSTQTLTLTPPQQSVYANLRITPAKAQELEQQRERVSMLVLRAQELYSARQYKEAIEVLDQALHLQPDYQGARQLRERVQQTMQILSIR